MPKTKRNFLELRSEKVEAMKEIVAAAEADGRYALNEDEQNRYDALKSEVDQLAQAYARQQEINKLTTPSDGEGRGAPALIKEIGDSPKTVRRRYSVVRALGLAAQNKPLDGLELEMHQEARQEFRDAKVSLESGPGMSISVPTIMTSPIGGVSEERAQKMIKESRAGEMIVGDDTLGGHNVQTDVMPYIEYLRPNLVSEQAGARVLTGLRGNVKFPRNDSIGQMYWEGEIDETQITTPTFDQFTLTPHRGSAFEDYSIQFLIQAENMNVEAFVRDDLRFAIANGVDQAVFNGTGQNDQPLGILNTPNIGDVSHGADGGAPTWAKALEFQTKLRVSNAEMETIAWVTTPAAVAKMMSVEKATNTAQFIINEPGRSLLGYPVYWSNNMPTDLTAGGSGATLHAAIFGNWRELIIGQFGGIDLIVDPYTQARKGVVRITINSYWDIGLRHPESFVAAKDIDIS